MTSTANASPPSVMSSLGWRRVGAAMLPPSPPPSTSTAPSTAPTSCSPPSASVASRAASADESVALDLGVLGQETAGPGGSRSGCGRCRSPSTSPSGSAPRPPTRGSSTSPTRRGWSPRRCSRPRRPGHRHLRLADGPRPAGRMRALGVTDRPRVVDYVGLNHLGWLRGLTVDGVDRLPGSSPIGRRSGRPRRGDCSGPNGSGRSARSPTSTCTTTTSHVTRSRRSVGRRDPWRVPAAPAGRLLRAVSAAPDQRSRHLESGPRGAERHVHARDERRRP